MELKPKLYMYNSFAFVFKIFWINETLKKYST